MGIFDIFTGDPAQDAAADNSRRLDELKAEGMGYLNKGRTGALDALMKAGQFYAPIAQKYGAGTNLYLDSLGVNGAQGNERATGAFQAGPGFQFAQDNALNALDRRYASRGMLASGNNSIDTLKAAIGYGNQEYGNWQNRLAGLIQPELAGVAGQATNTAAQAPVWTNDANQRVALASGVTSGLNSQATQSANAEMAGSGNLWNLIMSGAKLAAGGLGGGFGGAGGIGSLLGGGGSAINAGVTGGGYMGLGGQVYPGPGYYNG